MGNARAQSWQAALKHHGWRLLGRALEWSLSEGWLRGHPRDATTIWPGEVQLAWKRHSYSMLGALEAVADGPSVSTAEAYAHLLDDLEHLCERADTGALRWLDLGQKLGWDRWEAQTLALLAAMAYDQALARSFRYAWANMMQESPSLGYLARLLDSEERGTDAQGPLATPSALTQCGLVEIVKRSRQTPLSEAVLALSHDAARWLNGAPLDSSAWIPMEDAPALTPRLGQSLGGQLRRVFTVGRPRRFAVVGPAGCGQLALSGQLAHGMAVRGGLWHFNVARQTHLGQHMQALEGAMRGALVHDGALILDMMAFAEPDDALVAQLEDKLAGFPTGVIWWTLEPWPTLEQITPTTTLTLRFPNKTQRQALWQRALPKGLPKGTHRALAGRFLLSEDQIAATTAWVMAAPDLHGEALLERALEGARQQTLQGPGALATPQVGRVPMTRLVLDAETRTALEEIITYSQHRQALVQQWGFGELLDYGLGVTCLFAGPPGTGKSFAAQAVATALELELFRVDLSQLVSKYIGETEKHLAQLFAAAEAGEVMLLFDEADALFAKRTEVKSSVDRYANMEINYLLQRIEHFTGVVILTTNFETSLDDAFARRIRFRVRFEEPDEAARQKLWRALIPAQTPLANDVDLDLLATAFELSGGHIKEIVLRAASLAMSTPQRTVTQGLLWRSANLEHRKLGKLPVPEPLPESDLL